MKKALAGVLAVALAGVMAGSAIAQVPNVQVYFNPAHTETQAFCPESGPGTVSTLYVVMNNWNMNVTGVDFSIEMAEKAHRNFPFDNVNVVDADVAMLPFKDSTFDMGVAFASFPHFSNQQKALDEAHRVLRAGAKLYLIHLHSSKEIAAMHHRVGGAVEHDTVPTADKMRAMLQQSKFTDIQINDQTGLYLAVGTNAK